MPRGGRRLPQSCVDRLLGADLIVHAGDLTSLSVLRELQSYGEVVAVRGNVDDADLRAALPAVAVVGVVGARIGVLHDAGPAAGRLSRLRARFADVGAVVFGHSHQPFQERSPDGFQIFNPGSPTERRRAPAHTMGIACARPDGLRFELIVLE